MNKKFLSLVLALVMVLGTFGSVFAAEAPKADAKKDTKKVEETKKVPEKKDNNEKVQWLVDNEIVLGRKMNKDEKNNDLALDKNIQRAEITKLLVYAIGRQDLATKIHGQVKPYSDVKNDHWANGFITVGTTMASPKNALPFLHGYVDGSFKPENDVTYVELAKMLVVLVKDDLTQADFKSAVWPRDWMAWAAKLGILDGVKVEDSAKAAPRQDAFVMLYNALYKLQDLVAYPATETMGIISDVMTNKLVLNQGDFKKELTVSPSTNFVPAEYKNKVSNVINWVNAVKTNGEVYYIGSLVRVLSDDKGNVTHIIQLGNPAEMAKNGNGWEAVADHVASTANITGKTPASYDAVSLVNSESITLPRADVWTANGPYMSQKNVKINLTANTRYFVADNENGVLTQVKDRKALLDLFDRDPLETKKGVYVGYDVLPNAKVTEAKVVVVHDVDESMYGSDIVRIVTPGTINYKLEAQKPGQMPTAVEKFDLRDYKASFPLNYGFDKKDVVDLGAKDGKILINASEDNVYKIVDVIRTTVKDSTLSGSRIKTLVLEDKSGQRGKVDLKDNAKLFFGNQLEKNAKVQLYLEKDSKDKDIANLAKIVSVLDKDTALKGYLPKSITITGDKDRVEAQFVSAVEDGDVIHVKVKLVDNGTITEKTVTFEAPLTEKAQLEALVAGQRITFNDLGEKGAKYNKIDNVQLDNAFKADNDKVAKKAAAQKELDKVTAVKKAERPNGKAADEKNLTFEFDPALPEGTKVSYKLNDAKDKVTITLEKDGATKEFKDVAITEKAA